MVTRKKKARVSKRATGRQHKGPERPNGMHVITLRIDAASKGKLHELALKSSLKTGRNMSYNATILQLIQAG